MYEHYEHYEHCEWKNNLQLNLDPSSSLLVVATPSQAPENVEVATFDLGLQPTFPFIGSLSHSASTIVIKLNH